MTRLEWYEQVAETIQCNLEDFYENMYKEDFKRVGNNFRLEPCPMCRHSGCCTVGLGVNCFSCDWSGTHINAYQEYSTNILGKSLDDAVEMLEKFSNIQLPSISKEDYEEHKKSQRKQKILKATETFYHDKLMNLEKKFDYNGNKMTPLNYLLNVRCRKIETIKSLKVGFSIDFPELKAMLLESGFTDEEIKESNVWIPEGLFIFFYKHHLTRDIVRFNTKNPFKSRFKTYEKGVYVDGDEIEGFSIGDKSEFLYSPKFTFKKPFFVVEGEHDLASILDNGFDNVACLGGNVKESAFYVFKRASKEIYSFFDNDHKGEKYMETLNKTLPEKHVYKIQYDAEYKDPDEYFLGKEAMLVKDLISKAKPLDTDAFSVSDKDKKVWVAENRFRKLEFILRTRNDKGQIIGQANYYVDGKLIDREDDTTLVKCKGKMKPLNFLLSDAINVYFNTDLENKTLDELVFVYWSSSRKTDIINIIATRFFEEKSTESREAKIIKLRNSLKAFEEKGVNVFDAILKELNDLQNRSVASYLSIPKIKISQYFNVKNNDAYFYFTYVKNDGDAIRKLPFLIRNDKTLIRLDLLKRKDEQCMLLIDYKYELPFEVSNEVIPVDKCSLSQTEVEKYLASEIPKEELVPSYLISKIEGYIKMFYYTEVPSLYKMLALWCYGTYYYDLLGIYPYLYIQGEKGTGKSVIDAILEMFCFNARLNVNISDASLFRMAGMEGGTIILDEIENLTSRQKGADSVKAAVLKGGYIRNSPVMRYNAEKQINEAFDTFCPKVVSNIMGLDDIVEDRCVPVTTYGYKMTRENRTIDARNYYNENTGEIKEITSRCCLSAIENFKKLHSFLGETYLDTSSARLSQIINPLLALSKMVDEDEKNEILKANPKADLSNFMGEYERSLMEYHLNVITPNKKSTSEVTYEGIIKLALPVIAKELLGLVPHSEIEYTDINNHKYRVPIEFNKEEGWFEVNTIHFKCFIEEHCSGDRVRISAIPKALKSIHMNVFEEQPKRRVTTIENDDLLREFSGNAKPKVQFFRFFFKDFVKDNFLDRVCVKEKTVDISNKLF